MNRDDIIRMARTVRDGGHWNQLDIVNFGLLVAAHEREQCAQVCEAMDWTGRSISAAARGRAADECAAAIRATGEEPKRNPGYIVGDHWLQAAYTRICTGETEAEVMADYGYYP